MKSFITEKGLTIKRQNEILDDMLSEAQTYFSDDKIDASPNSLIGNFLNVFASQIADIWLGIQQVYDSFNPSVNEGKSLDDSCSLIAITRLEPSSTKVYITLIGEPGTKIEPGFEVECTKNNEIFVNQETLEIDKTGKITSLFFAKNFGPLICPEKTCTKIRKPITGLTSISNDNSQISIGRNRETDEELRIRRARSGSIIGQNVIQALQSKILDINDVSTVIIIENTSELSVNGLPPKSFQVLVEGGDEKEIGQIIWNNKPAGIETFAEGDGKVDISISIDNSFPQIVRFQRPSQVKIFVRINYILNKDEIPPSKEDREKLIKGSVIEYGKTIGISKDVIAQKFFGKIFENCPGLLTLKIQVAPIIHDVVGDFKDNIYISKTSYATFDDNDILVTEDV